MKLRLHILPSQKCLNWDIRVQGLISTSRNWASCSNRLSSTEIRCLPRVSDCGSHPALPWPTDTVAASPFASISFNQSLLSLFYSLYNSGFGSTKEWWLVWVPQTERICALILRQRLKAAIKEYCLETDRRRDSKEYLKTVFNFTFLSLWKV